MHISFLPVRVKEQVLQVFTLIFLKDIMDAATLVLEKPGELNSLLSQGRAGKSAVKVRVKEKREQT